MATDSTELTFVRCSSCRSLVPAVSTRCRMCGAGLDASDKREPEGERQPSRVRQRTLSATDSELNSAANKMRDSGAAEAPSSMELETASEEVTTSDPLSEFIEEVEVKEEASNGTQHKAEAAEEAAPKQPAPKPNVIVETGPRKSGAESRLSYGGAPKAPTEQRPAPRQEEQRRAEPRREEPRREEQPAREEPRREAKREEPRQQQRDPQPERREAPPREGERAQRIAPPQIASGTPQAGKLFGWLVSYSENLGNSIELREGQFFISKTALKPNDFIVDDGSISTPHALVKVSANGGFVIQDLLSEKGVHVRKSRSESYQRADELAIVENGNWIKFGDVEYLFVRLPQ